MRPVTATAAKRFAIATLGCKVNQYDSAIIEDRLSAAGFERADFDQRADVYIVNTCTVTDRADAESLRLARRARRLNPDARVVMTGCLAQAAPEKLAVAREVDRVIGLGRVEDIVRAAQGDSAPRVTVDNLRKHKAAIETAGVALAGHTRAFLKVQEGCNQFCSFCIVPFSRGLSRSVEPRAILDAFEELAGRGFREVTLTGVHLGGYGRDLAPAVTLESLLEMIAERSPIRRVRLSSLDPEELSDRIIDLMAASDVFCPHLHLPLQSGDDQTLAAMRRRYDSGYFEALLGRVLTRMPDCAIGTDLIVGFPGESPAHFERYFRFVESLPLAYFHVFPYSVRSGTTAAKLAGRVAPGEIKRRAALMRALGERKRHNFADGFCGARLEVLFEERTAGGELAGYSRNYIRVFADGPDGLRNHEVVVEASAARGPALVGRVVSATISHERAASAAGLRIAG